MSKSLCKGPLSFFLPLMLGGALTYFVAISLRGVFGVLPWYWFLFLFLLCVTLIVCAFVFVGNLAQRFNGGRRKREDD
jgi:hypothetical protein